MIMHPMITSVTASIFPEWRENSADTSAVSSDSIDVMIRRQNCRW
jgi:hypothetical protein